MLLYKRLFEYNEFQTLLIDNSHINKFEKNNGKLNFDFILKQLLGINKNS